LRQLKTTTKDNSKQNKYLAKSLKRICFNHMIKVRNQLFYYLICASQDSIVVSVSVLMFVHDFYFDEAFFLCHLSSDKLIFYVLAVTKTKEKRINEQKIKKQSTKEIVVFFSFT
jgi:hypothetical protein